MPTPLLNPAAENERLQLLLFEMPDRQEDFLEAAAAEGYHLDYTLATLPELERYLRDHAEALAWRDKSASAVAGRLDCWSYIGETFRQNFGGGWNVSLTNPDSVLYGQFVLQDFSNNGLEFSPSNTLQAYLLRGKPSIRSMMEAHVHVAPVDLSDLPEEADDAG
jgi:hypothetical protein